MSIESQVGYRGSENWRGPQKDKSKKYLISAILLGFGIFEGFVLPAAGLSVVAGEARSAALLEFMNVSGALASIAIIAKNKLANRRR